MCKFFSLVSDGHGSIRYFSVKERLEIEEQGNPKLYSFDSHSSICDYFEINEDKWNKYEFNPFTKKFNIDRLNNIDDSAHVKKQVMDMDFNPIFETGLFHIDLRYLKKLENFTFPEKCNNINLSRCKELNNVIFPKEMKEYLDLYSMKSLEGITLPKKYKTIDLCSINSWEFELPEKHGTICFKDKKVNSNY